MSVVMVMRGRRIGNLDDLGCGRMVSSNGDGSQ